MTQVISLRREMTHGSFLIGGSFYFITPVKYSFASHNLIFLLRLIETRKFSHVANLTLFLPITTEVPYANSFDPDEAPSNSASHPDQSCLTLRQHFQHL